MSQLHAAEKVVKLKLHITIQGLVSTRDLATTPNILLMLLLTEAPQPKNEAGAKPCLEIYRRQKPSETPLPVSPADFAANGRDEE